VIPDGVGAQDQPLYRSIAFLSLFASFVKKFIEEFLPAQVSQGIYFSLFTKIVDGDDNRYQA